MPPKNEKRIPNGEVRTEFASTFGNEREWKPAPYTRKARIAAKRVYVGPDQYDRATGEDKGRFFPMQSSVHRLAAYKLDTDPEWTEIPRSPVEAR